MKIPLQIPPGVVGDDTDFSTGGWVDSSGVRFWRGRAEAIKGWERLMVETLTGVCRTVFQWRDGVNLQTIAFGLHNGLTVWQSGTVADITPTSDFTPGEIDGTGGSGYGTGEYGVGSYGEPSTADYFPLTWSFGARSFGELYANPRGQGVFVWNNDTGTEAALLAGAPAVCTYLMVAFTDQVVAFGCTDTGGQFNPSCIRFSDISDPTLWGIATDNTAQQIYLKGNGRIVGARAVGQTLFVWTDSELHVGTYNGVWNFEPVGDGGLCGPNAAIVSGQAAYWIAPQLQFFACQLGSDPKILTCPIRDAFADNAAAGQNDKIVAAEVTERGELVWFYADQRDGFECSRALRLSTIDGAWAPDQLARSAFVSADPSPIGVTADGVVYSHERGSSADGSPLTAYVQTGGQYMDPGENVMLLRGVWPDFRDQVGAISLTITAWMYPQDTPTEHGPFILSAGQTKCDFLVTGRIFAFRFSGSSLPLSYRFGKPVFDVVPAGQN